MPCGHVHDSTAGDPDHGLPRGSCFEDLLADLACLLCGVGKAGFAPD
jgi:rubredoxin